MAYYKAIDPNTGAAEFRTLKEVQPEAQQAPQYVTADAFAAFQQQIEQRFQALTPKTSRKAVVYDDSE